VPTALLVLLSVAGATAIPASPGRLKVRYCHSQ